MAYTPLKISIPKPCHEDWNGMHPVPGTTARHCDSCAKNVVDFTGFSDAKMHAYVREQGGKLCGRFRPDQLNRPLRAVSTPTSNPLKVAVAAAGVLLAATGCETPGSATGTSAEQDPWQAISSSVQAHPPVTGGISLAEVEMATVGKIALPPPPPPPPLVGDIILELPPEEESMVITGAPIAENVAEAPRPTCGEKEIVFETIEGEIELLEEDFLVGDIDIVPEAAPPEVLAEQDTILPSEAILNAESIQEIPTRDIDAMSPAVMGMVAMEHPRPTGIDWVKDTLKHVLPGLPSEGPSLHQRPRPEMPRHLEDVTVFPNPFVDHLKVAIHLSAAEMLTVELLDPNGRLVFAQAWKAGAGANTLTIEPKQRKLTHAIYYLRVTDEREFSVVRTVVR